MTKILIVEDNELNLKLFTDILNYHNYTTDSVINGIEAVEKIKNNKYDLVILDIKLPKLDGFGILKKLKQTNTDIPKIIIATACAMDEDKLEAKKYNIETYITKPIDISSFITTIKNELEKN